MIRLPLAAAVLALITSMGSACARCVDEEQALPAADPTAAAPQAEPRQQLADMVREALARSQSLGAARLLADAALDDVEETRAGKAPQATLSAGVGPSLAQSGAVRETSALQPHASVSVSQLLWDGGRTDRMVDWRSQLAESARYGHLTQQEQVAMSTVALALERSRYRVQVQIYGQYTRKMACLVEALETIVKADRGRASELVQAKKSQAQAELQMVQAQSQVRQIEVRLRRLVGDGLPPVDGLSSLLLTVPDLAALQDDVTRAADIAQLDAQANAARQYAAAVEAGNKPQVSWSFGGSSQVGLGGNLPPSTTKNSSLQVGVQVSIPLMNPGNAHAGEAARKRAMAAALQRADAVDAKRWRVAEMYEQTQSTFDRARRIGAVLRDSDQVRNFTLQQWQQLGRRSLFDVMSAEGEHYNLRVQHVNALHDGQQLNALLLSLGRGVGEWLR